MDAIDALHTRNSVALLVEPPPTPQQLDLILKAGLRANDHGRLRPWRFLVVEGDARVKLGELMLSISLEKDPELSEKQRQAIIDKPLRAPVIVIVVAKVCHHDRIPEIEQVLSAGGAAQLMMAAAHALDIGAIWRTGSLTYEKRMVTGLGLAETDRVIGFLYMGKAKAIKPLDPLNLDDFVERWKGEN